MLYILCAIGGVIVGVILSRTIFKGKTLGDLLVITTHLNDRPYLCLDNLEVDPKIIKQMKRITFRVIARSNSHD